MCNDIKNNLSEEVQAIWKNGTLYFLHNNRIYRIPKEMGDYHIVFRKGKNPTVTAIGSNEPCSPRDVRPCEGFDGSRFDL